MTTLVLDASVAIKWAVPAANEPLADESIRIFRRFRDSEIDFLVPDIFWAEIGNVLWKGAKRQRWSSADAEMIASYFKDCDLQTVPSQLLLPEALKIAFTYDRNISDCLYVALAAEAQLELITADERLANAMAARFPVKWLGAF